MATQKTTKAQTPGEGAPPRAKEGEKLEAVKASSMEAAPEDQTGPTGSSFYNPATVGSGTILADGTYGSPLPDPNVARLRDESDR